jgi:ribosomal protein S18 acetylase RimI-like enzyme
MKVSKSNIKSAQLGFRFAYPDEEDRLVAIERRCFPHAWTRDGFRSDFHLTVSYLVGDPDAVVGYIATRRWADVIVIESVAIDLGFQRMGFGRQMLAFAAGFVPAMGPLGKRRATKATALQAWVWERNLIAQNFFKLCGFHTSKFARDFYEGEAAGDAAYLFSRPLAQHVYEKYPIVRIAE